MKPLEEKYIRKSLEMLQKWMPKPVEEMMNLYAHHPKLFSLEESMGYVYCLFTYADDVGNDQIILLVYEGDTVIADLSGIHTDMLKMMTSLQVYDDITTESDWMYLEHYVLCNYYFDAYPYPYVYQPDAKLAHFSGEVMLFRNVYVTRRYRRQGIMKQMLEMVRDWILKDLEGEISYYSCISMDMDIACYGPDTVDEPYVYSFDVDEPIRLMNKEILESLDYTCLRLEEEEQGDGTKCWFAVKKERDIIVDTSLN